MRVWCSLLPSLSDARLLIECAIVIDVLRATSVITTALAANAKEVTTCLDIADAVQLGQQVEPRPLLCGERKCKPIEGFDLGNSPAEYNERVVSSRSLVMTTTNGTRAIAAAKDAEEIILASFLNLAAVVEFVSRYSTLHLICAGTDGQITGEDVLLAGAILSRLADSQQVTFENDSCALAKHYWQGNNDEEQTVSLASCFAGSLGGRNLIAAGFESDLFRCAAIDITSVIPRCVARAPYRFITDH